MHWLEIGMDSGGKLEQIAETSGEKHSLVRRAYNNVYKTITSPIYWTDVSSGWTFFTPICAAIEHYGRAHMEWSKVGISRSLAMAAHMIAMRPTGKIRNALAAKWGVTKESPIYKKLAVNACALTPIQAALYTGMLACAGVYPDSETYRDAMLTVIPTTLVLSEPFGRWQDFWRGLWGRERAIK